MVTAAAEKSPEREEEEEERNPRAEVFLGIIRSFPAGEVEAELSACGVGPTAEVAELVLRGCYKHPRSAVRFFRWAGRSVSHTALAWNLLVNILGKAAMFEPMWDAIRSMKQEGGSAGLVSVATFASVFDSYCATGNLKEAVAALDVMDRYGLKPDAVALNSLLSAICRAAEGSVQAAHDVFNRTKAAVPPDADTFAILLEACEKEGNAVLAKSLFGEMVVRVGWDSDNVAAYDSFLTTLVRAGLFDEACKFLQVMRTNRCLPGINFFATAVDLVVRKGDYNNAIAIWNLMVSEANVVPNISMYSAMIGLYCTFGSMDFALAMLDEMPLNGVFANSVTYNTILEGFIKHRKAREAESFLKEMSKNEQLPTASNCASAISLFFKEFNPSAAIDVWRCIVDHDITPAEDSAKGLIAGLLDFSRLTEVEKRANQMIDMRVELSRSTLENMKRAFAKANRHQEYDRIARRLKRH